jgi:hypothetical protein
MRKIIAVAALALAALVLPTFATAGAVTDHGTSAVHFDIPWCASAPISMDGTADWHLVRHNNADGTAERQTFTVHYDLTSVDGFVYSSDQTNQTTWHGDLADYTSHEVQFLDIYTPAGDLYYHAYTDKTDTYAGGVLVNESINRWDVGCS